MRSQYCDHPVLLGPPSEYHPQPMPFAEIRVFVAGMKPSVPYCVLIAAAVLFAGCSDESAPGRTYYQRNVEPILLQTCSRNVSGCHSINDDDPFAFAAGNFDVTSFAAVQKRRDLLEPYGAYQIPLLLIKAVGSTDELGVNYRGNFEPLEIQHAGGNIIEVNSEAYLTLLDWTANGATENGLPPVARAETGGGGCTSVIPDEFDPTPYVESEFFDQFRNDVQPVLVDSCASAVCHGAPQSDFYLTCGDDEDSQAYNFLQVQAFIDDPVDNSPILQYPLAVRSGGYFHSGGEFFSARGDGDYAAIKEWAESVGPIEFAAADDAGRQFFADHVQPVLLRRGCMHEGCHSPGAANDFKLRSGSQGFFSAVALEKNYTLMRDVFMAMEVPDARRGRAVAKGLIPSAGGIAHRGGPVMETPGAGRDCGDGPFDPEGEFGKVALCVMEEWVRIEREALVAADEILPLGEGDSVPIVYVDRSVEHTADLLDFDQYQPGSDLRAAQATVAADGALSVSGTPVSLLDTCPGAEDRAVVDVRGPDVRRDGTTVAFAMRLSADEALAIYTVELAAGGGGENCRRVIADPPGEQNGLKIHDFDPAWSPDGEYLVFASSRGGTDGPTLSRQKYLVQSDIWRMHADGEELEPMTFLTNSEISPQFIREGRLIMTTEKASEGFYQLAGRRINWDLTDYHPLLGQRAESPFANADAPTETLPSVGYAQVTEIREGFDGNFVVIFSDVGTPAGAGTLAIFNRSVGTFEAGRNDPGYLAAVTIPDPAATGRVGSDTDGAYRSPHSLLDGRIMASYAAYGGDLAQASALDWDLVAVDPRTGDREVILAGDGAVVEAVLALKHPERELYGNRRQLVFGGGVDTEATGGEDFGIMHFPDAPMLFTLLNANLRRGRPVELFRSAEYLAFYEERPAPAGTDASGGLFEERVFLGRARLAADGSARVRVPARKGLILELQDGDRQILETMREEHQIGPGETISIGVSEPLFDAICAGCHGSVSGRELDIFVTPDALTGASESLSADSAAVDVSP